MDLLYRVFCPEDGNCPPATLIDLTTENCNCAPFTGRIGEFIMLACTAKGTGANGEILDADLSNPALWTDWLANGMVRRSGIGIGSLKTTNTANSGDLGGCQEKTVITMQTHEFTFIKKCLNLTGATGNDIDFANQVAQGALSKYNIFLRTCGGNTETLILMSTVIVTSVGNVEIPAGINEVATMEYKFERKKLGPLGMFTVPGLNAVIPPLV